MPPGDLLPDPPQALTHSPQGADVAAEAFLDQDGKDEKEEEKSEGRRVDAGRSAGADGVDQLGVAQVWNQRLYARRSFNPFGLTIGQRGTEEDEMDQQAGEDRQGDYLDYQPVAAQLGSFPDRGLRGTHGQ